MGNRIKWGIILTCIHSIVYSKPLVVAHWKFVFSYQFSHKHPHMAIWRKLQDLEFHLLTEVPVWISQLSHIPKIYKYINIQICGIEFSKVQTKWDSPTLVTLYLPRKSMLLLGLSLVSTGWPKLECPTSFALYCMSQTARVSIRVTSSTLLKWICKNIQNYWNGEYNRNYFQRKGMIAIWLTWKYIFRPV